MAFTTFFVSLSIACFIHFRKLGIELAPCDVGKFQNQGESSRKLILTDRFKQTFILFFSCLLKLNEDILENNVVIKRKRVYGCLHYSGQKVWIICLWGDGQRGGGGWWGYSLI